MSDFEEQAERERILAKVEKMKDSKFRQQNLPAYRPEATFLNTIITFTMLGIILVSVGIHLQVQSGKIQEFVFEYDKVCTIGD